MEQNEEGGTGVNSKNESTRLGVKVYVSEGRFQRRREKTLSDMIVTGDSK